MGLTKAEILRDVFLLHWEWDTEPEITDVAGVLTADIAGSTEDIILKMYPRFKKDALAKYNWRSAIKYATLECTEPVTNKDPRYKYTATLPEDFIKLVGLWADKERNNDARGKASTVSTTLYSHLEDITIGYMADIDEEDLDNWVSTYLIAYIASKGATIAGVSNEKRAELISQEQNEWFTCSNIDYEMEVKDEVSPSLSQFLIS